MEYWGVRKRQQRQKEPAARIQEPGGTGGKACTRERFAEDQDAVGRRSRRAEDVLLPNISPRRI